MATFLLLQASGQEPIVIAYSRFLKLFGSAKKAHIAMISPIIKSIAEMIRRFLKKYTHSITQTWNTSGYSKVSTI
jgi:thiaminase